MTLCDKLRAMSARASAGQCLYAGWGIMDDAAAEIERLRAEVDRLQEELNRNAADELEADHEVNKAVVACNGDVTGEYFE